MSISNIEIDSSTDRTLSLSRHPTADEVVCEAVDMTVLTSLEGAQAEGESDLIVELINLYLEDTPRRVAAMQAAIAETDEMSLRRAAHNLRGSSASLGARRMATLCEELERADCNDSFQKGSMLLTSLEHELERVRQAFTAERQRRS